jgi:hypothetical protein
VSGQVLQRRGLFNTLKLIKRGKNHGFLALLLWRRVGDEVEMTTNAYSELTLI